MSADKPDENVLRHSRHKHRASHAFAMGSPVSRHTNGTFAL